MSDSKLYGGKLNLSKIPKDKIFKSEKTGHLWLDITIWVNPLPDDYDNHVSIQVGQTKAQREANEPKIYIGNAKELAGGGGMEKASAGDLEEMAF